MSGESEVGGRSGMVAGTGSPSTVYPSTREERGTAPQSSGRICGEEVRGVNTALKKFGSLQCYR